MIDWEWYQNPNVVSVFLHCLLKANHKEKKWQGQLVKRGQFITSYQNMSNELSGKHGKITVMQIRTALNKLKSTGELTIKGTNRFTVIAVNKYDMYQEDNTRGNKQITNKQQTDNKQITTNKNVKNVKNEKKRESKSKSISIKKEKNAQVVLKWFNQSMGTSFKATHGFSENLAFWMKVYNEKDIQNALDSIRDGKWWATDPNPTLLFRRKNKGGEAVDYIGELLNTKGGERNG